MTVKRRLEKLALFVVGSSPADLAGFFKAETDKVR
jgi:hypothetical protein